jgi:uncharacterized protein YndB with AHSA1/START domain
VAQVVTEIKIAGPIEHVFDVVTTTKHWPAWHPATLGVSGVTERPLAQGDVVRERAQIGPRAYEGDWTVVEHVRPERVVLQILGRPLQITYSFASTSGGTTFHRELDYPLEGFLGSAADPAAVQRLMEEQSAEGLKRLKVIVESQLAPNERS